MKSTFEKRFVRTVLAASIAALGVSALHAAAADDEVAQLIRPDSQVELGLGYVSEDSYKFGRYTGLHREGVHAIGSFDLNRRNEANTHYFSLTGRNLGLDSRNLTFNGGEQGNFGLRLEYDEIPRFGSDSYQTPYLGAGSTRLIQPTGPSGVADATTTAGMVRLAANMKPFDIKTKRKELGIGATKALPKGWEVEANVKRENKDGNKLTAAMMQAAGGGTRGSVFVAEPIDYTTDQYEALARYTSDKVQLQFGYYASLFKNENESVTWDSLFNAGTNDANQTGRYGLPPDNEAHQISASGRYVLSKATSLSASLAYGRQTQNELFLPYSTAGTGALSTERFPVTPSLNGKVYTTNATLKINSKLTPKLSVAAGLRYDDRDNKTDIAVYDYITGDRNSVAGQRTATTNLQLLRRNMPLDINKQLVHADMDYQVASGTKVKVGYAFQQVRHNYEPTTGDKEHTVKTEVRHRFSDMVSAGASYAYSDREASEYNGAAPMSSTYSAAYLATLFATGTGRTYAWLEAPGLRKYFLADRERNKIGAFANVSPTDKLDLQFGAHYLRDTYPNSPLGITKASNWIASFDANLQATDALSGNFFASVDQYKTEQTGGHLPTAAFATAAERGTIPAANLGFTNLADRTYTVGVGVRFKPLRKYEVGSNLTHSSSKGRSDFMFGSAVLPAGPLPDLISRVSRLEMFSRYDLKKDLTVVVKFAHERYRSADWAWDAPLTLTSVASVVGTNQTSPNYSVNFVGVSLAYKF